MELLFAFNSVNFSLFGLLFRFVHAGEKVLFRHEGRVSLGGGKFFDVFQHLGHQFFVFGDEAQFAEQFRIYL